MKYLFLILSSTLLFFPLLQADTYYPDGSKMAQKSEELLVDLLNPLEEGGVLHHFAYALEGANSRPSKVKAKVGNIAIEVHGKATVLLSQRHRRDRRRWRGAKALVRSLGSPRQLSKSPHDRL